MNNDKTKDSSLPSTDKDAFRCLHCGNSAQMKNSFFSTHIGAPPLGAAIPPKKPNELEKGVVRSCSVCGGIHVWISTPTLEETLVYPPMKNVVEPADDMRPDVRDVFEEASAVFPASPRAAAALLRLAVQMLVEDVLGKKCKVNDGIAELVSLGLPAALQQALDIVRVTGNDAVHPGQIDTDDERTVASLFHLVNLIVERMIAEPRRIEELYRQLPEEKLKQIDKRDKQ